MEQISWREPGYFARRRLRKLMPFLLTMGRYQLFLFGLMLFVVIAMYFWVAVKEQGIAMPWKTVFGHTLLLSCMLFLPMWLVIFYGLLVPRRVLIVLSPKLDFRVNDGSRRVHTHSMHVRRFGAGHALLRVQMKSKSGERVRRAYGIHPRVDLELLEQFCREWKAI